MIVSLLAILRCLERITIGSNSPLQHTAMGYSGIPLHRPTHIRMGEDRLVDSSKTASVAILDVIATKFTPTMMQLEGVPFSSLPLDAVAAATTWQPQLGLWLSQHVAASVNMSRYPAHGLLNCGHGCGNHGTCNEHLGACQCSSGFVGSHCQRRQHWQCNAADGRYLWSRCSGTCDTRYAYCHCGARARYPERPLLQCEPRGMEKVVSPWQLVRAISHPVKLSGECITTGQVGMHMIRTHEHFVRRMLEMRQNVSLGPPFGANNLLAATIIGRCPLRCPGAQLLHQQLAVDGVTQTRALASNLQQDVHADMMAMTAIYANTVSRCSA